MRFILFLTLLFGVYILTCFCYEERDYKDPKHPGKCVVKPDMILSEGDQVRDPDSKCGEIRCHDDGKASITSCRDIAIDPPFGHSCTYADPDLTKDYPSCCIPVIKCETYGPTPPKP